MKTALRLDIKAAATLAALAVGAVFLAGILLIAGCRESDRASVPPSSPAVSNAPPAEATVELVDSQLKAIKVGPVGTRLFPVEKEAVGSIDYDQDLSVQVFSPYSGKIVSALANLGEDVQKGQPLYTIESPDLIQGESSLIGAAASYALTTKELARARDLRGTNGISEREVEQATSEQQTAEGALKAAKNAVRIFGKSEAEVEQIAASRKIDPVLVVGSPVKGRVTGRNAQPGLLVQPGGVPAPYWVADLSSKWMVANVTETDSPLFRVGQPVRARVEAYPGREFTGAISRMGSGVDPTLHRLMVRCDIADPDNELRAGMLANFVIQVKEPVESLAIPMAGVVRNGDGTMTGWVTSDRHRFTQRVLKVGLPRGGYYPVLEGLKRGEMAVTEGAVFLSNMLEAPPTD